MSAEPIAEPTDEPPAASADGPSDEPPAPIDHRIAEWEVHSLQQVVVLSPPPPPMYWGPPAPPPERLWARLLAGWLLLAAGLLGFAQPFTTPDGTRVFTIAVLDLSFAA